VGSERAADVPHGAWKFHSEIKMLREKYVIPVQAPAGPLGLNLQTSQDYTSDTRVPHRMEVACRRLGRTML